jgi:hypothetical protein
MILVCALDSALRYLETVATAPAAFENPPIVVVERRAQTDQVAEEDDWQKLMEDEKPSVSVVAPTVMKEELRQMRRWKKFEETGQAPDSDSDEDEDEEEGEQGAAFL